MTSLAPARAPRGGRSKSRLIAITLSGLFPGLGQVYNGDPWRGLAFAVAGALTAFGPLNPLDIDIDIDDPVRGLRNVLLASLPFLAVALWSVIDAGRRAVLPEEH
jgi:hypothetical protein